MTKALDASFEFCRQLAKREARNFYFSFLTLPKEKRLAMCAIYSWMRRLDDLADDAPSPQEARVAVEQWRDHTRNFLEGNLNPEAVEKESDPSLWPAFVATVKRCHIPYQHFHEIAEGALMDQEILRYESFDDLYQYCYRVASLVGMVSLRVFEYEDPQTEKVGEWLGIAFQLTNIIRDVREDAARGRIYLPLQDLNAFGVSEKDLLENRWSDSLHELLQSFSKRTEEYYERAKPVVGLVSSEARPTLKIMTEIYHGILDEIRKMDYRVLDKRARVPTWKKFAIVFKHQVLK